MFAVKSFKFHHLIINHKQIWNSTNYWYDIRFDRATVVLSSRIPNLFMIFDKMIGFEGVRYNYGRNSNVMTQT
jgi:hypothetical protein